MQNASASLSYSDPSGVALKYRLFVPDTTNLVPLVVFLHGAGQRGLDNVKQLVECDVGHVVSYATEYRKAVIVVPQCPLGVEWVDDGMIDVLVGFVSEISSNTNLNVDTDRVYIVGFSMGGYGTWKLLMKSPETFAAAIPVCGGPLSVRPKEVPTVPETMKAVSVWAFNNYDDEVVNSMHR